MAETPFNYQSAGPDPPACRPGGRSVAFYPNRKL